MKPDYVTLRTVLANLEAQHEHLLGLDPATAFLTLEGISESVIQRFEICYDMAWKVLRKFLISELIIPEVPNSPKPVLRAAAENTLLGDAGQRRQDYSTTRTQTTYMYGIEFMTSAIQVMPAFIRDTANLVDRMEQYPSDD